MGGTSETLNLDFRFSIGIFRLKFKKQQCCFKTYLLIVGDFKSSAVNIFYEP